LSFTPLITLSIFRWPSIIADDIALLNYDTPFHITTPLRLRHFAIAAITDAID
jgi:hypothetical protein